MNVRQTLEAISGGESKLFAMRVRCRWEQKTKRTVSLLIAHCGASVEVGERASAVAVEREPILHE